MKLKIKKILPCLLLLTYFSIHSQIIDENYKLREDLVINTIADKYNPPAKNIGDPEKYYWPRAMARLYKYGKGDPQANADIEELATKGAFHFAIVGMTRLLYQFSDAPAIMKSEDRILQKNLSAGLTTSEGTENHLSMERTSIYLFAQRALQKDPNNALAKETLDMTRDWILTWSKRVYELGVGEWNSSTYALYNMIGWLNLYDFAEDIQIKESAHAVVDYYAAECALHYSFGAPGGSEMRGNKDTDKNRTSASYLDWLWFSGDDKCLMDLQPAEYIQLIHPILSSYTPPKQIIDLAKKENVVDDWYQNSKPSYLYEYPSFCKQDFYISENFTLGNLVCDYGGYTGASYAIIPWRLVIKQNKGCPIEIGGGGRYRDAWSGQSRAPFTQTAQYKNTLILMTMMPENHDDHYAKVTKIIDQWKKDWEKDYFQRHGAKDNVVNMIDGSKRSSISYLSIPENLKYEIEDGKVFVDAGTVFLIISTLHNPKFSSRGESGRKLFYDQSQTGELSAYVLEVVEKKEINDLNSLKEASKQITLIPDEEESLIYTNLRGDELKAKFNSYGTCIEPLFDWGYGTTEPMCLLSSPPLRQPDWGFDYGFGKTPDFYINGVKVNYNEEWPVYDGPRFTLNNSVLTIKGDDDSIYTVDYSDETPVWKEMEASIKSIYNEKKEECFHWSLNNSELTIFAKDENIHYLSIYDLSGKKWFSDKFIGTIKINLNLYPEGTILVKTDESVIKILN